MPVTDEIRDFWGDRWRVTDSQQTPYGFRVYYGRPAETSGPQGSAIIITRELAELFQAYRYNPGDMDLPFGKTARTRIRQRLGHNRYRDSHPWWEARLDDLASLTLDEFCRKHEVSSSAAQKARASLVSNRQEPTTQKGDVLSDPLHQALIIRALRANSRTIHGAALAALRVDVIAGKHADTEIEDPAAERARLMAIDLSAMPPETDDVALLLETLSQRLDGAGYAAAWRCIGVKPNRGRDMLARHPRAVDWPIWKTLRDAALERV